MPQAFLTLGHLILPTKIREEPFFGSIEITVNSGVTVSPIIAGFYIGRHSQALPPWNLLTLR